MENHSSDKTPKVPSDKKKLIINHRFEVRDYRQESGSSKIYNGIALLFLLITMITGFDLATKNEILLKFVSFSYRRNLPFADKSRQSSFTVPDQLFAIRSGYIL